MISRLFRENESTGELAEEKNEEEEEEEEEEDQAEHGARQVNI